MLPEQYKLYNLSFKIIIVIVNTEVGKSCVTLKATKIHFKKKIFQYVFFNFLVLM